MVVRGLAQVMPNKMSKEFSDMLVEAELNKSSITKLRALADKFGVSNKGSAAALRKRLLPPAKAASRKKIGKSRRRMKTVMLAVAATFIIARGVSDAAENIGDELVETGMGHVPFRDQSFAGATRRTQRRQRRREDIKKTKRANKNFVFN